MPFHRYEPSDNPEDHEEISLEEPDNRPEVAAAGPHDPTAVAPGVVFTDHGAVAVTKEQARLRKEAACPKCGYSIVGLKSANCPECGVELLPALAAAARKAKAREGLKHEYTVAGCMLGGGLLVALACATILNGGSGALLYLISFAVTIPFAFAAYLICCTLWIGFDMPIAITALRLAAIYAWADAFRVAIVMLLGDQPVFMVLAWLASIVVIFWLLNKWLELDFVDSIGLALGTIIVFIAIAMSIYHWTH